MPQTSAIAAYLLVGWIVYIILEGELTSYLHVLGL